MRLALCHLRRGNNGQPLIDVLTRGVRLFAEQRHVVFRGLVVACQLEQQVRARGVRRSIADRRVRPVDNASSVVICYNDVGRVKVAVAQFVCLGMPPSRTCSS